MEKKREYLKKGLSSQSADKLLQEHGENVLPRGRRMPDFKILIEQFKSPLIYILIFAFLATLFLGEYSDALVIFLAVLANTILGFFQERKAERSLEALQEMLKPTAKVVRDGKMQVVEARTLVPGDVVLLERGERVPADGVVVEEKDLSMEEAILTGESEAVEKKAGQVLKFTEATKKKPYKDKVMVFMGTIVSSGHGKMVVIKTGKETRMGGIARSLKEIREEKTPLQKKVAGLARFLALLFGVLCFLIFVGGVIEGRDVEQMFVTAVAIAVAAVPEGMPVSLTVILALGMQRILKKKALTRKLLAAETLGSVTTICADKTGTLTEGQMRVSQVKLADEEKGVLAASLCNNLSDPLEVALRDWGRKYKSKDGKGEFALEEILEKAERLGETSFTEERKFMAVTVEIGEERMVLLKGAPEVIIDKCRVKNDELRIKKIRKEIEEMGEKGLRLIALAWKRVEKGEMGSKRLEGLTWVGVLGLEDPVRAGVADALREVKGAGIKVKVITGDYRATAEAVVKKLGLLRGDLRVMSGEELERVSEEEFIRIIDEVILFYRTTPKQKLKIVEVLKKKGEVVAMTGDGVNDAPALKRADIGIVVSSASDVSKETADMVLLDDNFKTIVAAVEEGRGIFENIRKVVLYLLSDTFSEVILVGVSVLLALPLPILPAQILWINLIEDGLPDMALALEPKDKGLMKLKPRKPGMPILDLELKVLIFIIGIVTDLILLVLFFFFLWRGFEIAWIRTMIFAGLGIDSLFYVFSCKSLKKPLWREDLLNNKVLIGSVVVGFLMLFASLYWPVLQKILGTVALGLNEWILLLGLGILDVAMIEGVKWFFIKNKGLKEYKE